MAVGMRDMKKWERYIRGSWNKTYWGSENDIH